MELISGCAECKYVRGKGEIRAKSLASKIRLWKRLQGVEKARPGLSALKIFSEAVMLRFGGRNGGDEPSRAHKSIFRTGIETETPRNIFVRIRRCACSKTRIVRVGLETRRCRHESQLPECWAGLGRKYSAKRAGCSREEGRSAYEQRLQASLSKHPFGLIRS